MKKQLFIFTAIFSFLLISGKGFSQYTHTFGTYAGGSGFCGASNSEGYLSDVAVDNAGNTYIVVSAECNFSTTAGSFQPGIAGGIDCWVAKLSPNGNTLIWATYLGGTGNDRPVSVAVDASYNVYVCGYTESQNFPSTPGAFQTAWTGANTAFVTKINPAGTALVYSTFLDGSSGEYAYGIAVNNSGEAFVAGHSASADFPTTAGSFQPVHNGPANYQDIFVTRLNAAGTGLIYSTFIGGSNGWGEWAADIALTKNDEACITGKTTSTTFPMQNAYQSAFGTGSYKMFVTKINATGSALIFSTYLGGSGEEDIGTGIATDTAGAVYVTGCTGSSNFPVTPGAFQTAFGGGNIMNGIWQASDAFVTKFNSSGTLVYSTFLGGSGDENEYYDTFNGDVALAIHGWGKIAVNRAGEAHLVGHTQSPNFPLTAGAFQTTGTSGGTYNNYDFFFTVLNAAGSNLVYSTYVGGSTIAPGGNSAREYVGNIALIENTCAGATTVIGAGTSHSDGFPTTAGVFQPAKLNSYADQPVIFRFSLGAGTFLTASVTATPATCGNSDGSATVTASGGTPGYTYSWIPSGGSSSTATGLSAGNYTCIVTDGNGCSQAQIITINNSNGPTVTTATTPQTCVQGGTATANASGGTLPYTYQWCNGQTTSAASNLSAGTCTVTVTDAGGCSVTSTVTITSSVSTPSTAVTSTPAACGNNNGTSTVTASGGNGSYTYGWSTSPVQTTATATGLAGGTYTITVTDANGCTKTATVSITQTGGPTVTTSTTPQTCTAGGTATANPSGGTSPYTYQWCNGQTGSTASNLSAGSCTVTVIDAGGCSTTSTVVITSSGSIPTATVTSTPASCGNNNGTATANVSGGTSPYTYSWNPTGQTSSAATGLAAGVYTVTVTDAIGCSAIQTISVTSNSTLNATITSTQTGCTVNNGTATASVSGGTSPYTYLWNPSGQTASTATGLGAGNYSVTMTDANGCTQTQTAVITSVPGPAAAVSAASTNITIGNNTSLTATGGGTYSWSPAAGLSCATCANPVATPSQTTTYCVVVTDGNGCTDNACLTINIDIPCGDIFVPNAFSPNNDGENELECVLGSCIETLKFSIFDRWGEKVFETTDPKICWDGTYKGKLLNTAAFVYYLKGVLTSGEKINRKGNISLIR